MTPLLNGLRVHLQPLRIQSYQNALNALRTPRAEKWVIVAVAESVSSREQSDRLAFVRLARPPQGCGKHSRGRSPTPWLCGRPAFRRGTSGPRHRPPLARLACDRCICPLTSPLHGLVEVVRCRVHPAHGLVALLGAAGHEILVDLGKRDAARLHRRRQRVDVLLVE